jgi:hypothetical protein
MSFEICHTIQPARRTIFDLAEYRGSCLLREREVLIIIDI